MRIASDSVRIVKAVLTNQVAKFSASAYMRLTRETGRGEDDGATADDVARYFIDSFDEYFEAIGVARADLADALSGKVVLEYGPGDVLGVALMLAAYGARKVYCVDRFSLVQPSPFNIAVTQRILSSLHGEQRERAESCFLRKGDPSSGFGSGPVEYLVRPNGLSGLEACVDLVLSRAVLEHVNDLEATFADMLACLRPGGLAAHLVDLRSHGLHRVNPLDFLEWSAPMWKLMYSHKGVPNRWRLNRYREIVGRLPFDVLALKPTQHAEPAAVAEMRNRVAAEFRDVSDADLACIGFWLVCRKRGGEGIWPVGAGCVN